MSQFTHDVTEAARFLQWLRPVGQWHLSAIHPGDGKIASVAIDAVDVDRLGGWLTAVQPWNVYYSLNPLRRQPRFGKARKDDLAAVEFLHVDVDPRTPDRRADGGEPTVEQKAAHNAAEKHRISDLLANPPHGIPSFSAVIDSGGGYQGLLRLVDPIAVDGDETIAERADLLNLKLLQELGGDPGTHDVSRILRLPGTINWPDKRKLAKGRVACRSTVVRLTDARYPTAAFVAATVVQPTGRDARGFASPRSRQPPPDARRYSMDEIREAAKFPDMITDKLRAIILEGHDPDDPDRFTSGGKTSGRSEALRYVCCQLVRAGVDKNVIYGVITDPDHRISSSVIEKGSGRERYAWRQVERAEEDAVDPQLADLNDKHAVIANLGGKCVVMQEVKHPVFDRYVLTTQSFDGFQNRYCNRQVKVGTKTTKNGEIDIFEDLGKWWLRHRMRREYEGIAFVPGGPAIVDGQYNLWQGFAVDPAPGDRHAPWLGHVRDNICSGDEATYRYLVGWMATAVQRPAEPGQVAIVLRGEMGTGKGVFANTFGALFGRHHMQITNAKHLVGNFNAHLMDLVSLFADEAFYARDKTHESVLKMLVTERMLPIERKGFDVENAPNCVHLIMASNKEFVVPAGPNERRFCVVDVSTARMQDASYWKPLMERFAADDRMGLRNLLHYLLHYDLTGFDVGAFPRTEALGAQKRLSMAPEEEWWWGKLDAGILLPHVEWQAEVAKTEIVVDYSAYMRRIGVNQTRKDSELWAFLRRVAGGTSRQQRRKARGVDGSVFDVRVWTHRFPPLADCRARWESLFGGRQQWAAVTDDEPLQSTDAPF